jgi:fermentation-respiration switch protein FrsA (DUF1100 family)
MRMPGRALAILLLAPLAGCFTFRVNESFFFHPMAVDTVGERVEVKGEDGTVLVGRFLETAQARGTLVYFGGNVEYVDLSGKTMKRLAGFRLNVLMVDYRGYGASAGKPSMDTFFSDGLAVFRYARSRSDAQGLPLVVYGFSLGGYAAAHVAAQESCSALILEATGTNVESWAKLVTPWYFKPFVRVRIDEKLSAVDNTASVRRSRSPLLVLTGGADGQAPAPMSRSLFDASPSDNKSIHVFPSGDHGAVKEEAEFSEVFSTFLGRAHL